MFGVLFNFQSCFLKFGSKLFFPLKARVVPDTVKNEKIGNSKTKSFVLVDSHVIPNPIRKSKHLMCKRSRAFNVWRADQQVLTPNYFSYTYAVSS